MIKKFVTPTLIAAGIALLLIGLPLLGAWLDGKPLRPFFTLTATPDLQPPAPFSWGAFVAVAAAILLVMGPFFRHLIRSQEPQPRPKRVSTRRLPWWGRIGLMMLLVSWALAWTRFPWFEPLQDQTFVPLWLSFILVVNGITHKRTGRCMLTHEPVYLIALFAASPVFWWFFEYLNRFAANWSYHAGHDELLALNGQASLAFATVLPGVASTCDLLATFPRLWAGMGRFVRIDIGAKPLAPLCLLLISAVALVGIGIRPDLLYPFLWLSPLLLIVSVQQVAGYETVFSPLKSGNWSHLWLMAISALACGFFWEMWNMFSLARWTYAIPYVGRFHVFEMPLLGYGGYLPFGLECAVVCHGVRRLVRGGEGSAG
ncbi:hypothetical protein [Desulfoluna butyratoxydans]|uniref:Uncharacterized protein n=1 Tax=Desulfoluna butyratoxydans TaxID=231438 RepID=A0A4U8YPX1_9BACT|nr:hypothetical protein [Desulfoluna butyratoxydans]VFQ45487.1 hypothetical protein MSL71_31440 [Desulfoluna butyratoxydans]